MYVAKLLPPDPDHVVSHRDTPLLSPACANQELRLDTTEGGAGIYTQLHPDVSSIYFAKSYMEPPVPGLLLDALSPAGAGEAPMCPKFDSISSFASAPLLNCLLNRENPGFGLRCSSLGTWILSWLRNSVPWSKSSTSPVCRLK